MGFWNHRVIQRKHIGLKGTPDEYTETSFSIVEMYYNADGSFLGETENDVAPYGETLDELRECLNRMLRALDNPVLIDGQIEYGDTRTSASVTEMEEFRAVILAQQSDQVALDTLPVKAIDGFYDYIEEVNVNITSMMDYDGEAGDDLVSRDDVVKWINWYIARYEAVQAAKAKKEDTSND